MKTKEENELNQEKTELTPGQKFWEELKKRPYDLDKVGQSFVILQKRPFKGGKEEEKKEG